MYGNDFYYGYGRSDWGQNGSAPELFDGKEASKSISRCFLALTLISLITIALQFLFSLFYIIAANIAPGSGMTSALYSFINSQYYTWVMSLIPMYLIAFPISLLIILPVRHSAPRKRTLSLSYLIALVPVCYAAMYAGSLIGNIINLFFMGIKGGIIEDQLSELISSSDIWLTILVTVIIAPALEEIIFRKLLIDRLYRYGEMFSILVSGIAFGIYHQNFYQFFYAAFIGLIFGYVYCKSGRVIYTILLHMILNFLGGALPMFVYDAQDRFVAATEDMRLFAENINSVLFYLSYIVFIILMVIAGLILFALNIKKLRFEKPNMLIPPKDLARATFANVGMIMFLVLSAIMFALSIFM